MRCLRRTDHEGGQVLKKGDEGLIVGIGKVIREKW